MILFLDHLLRPFLSLNIQVSYFSLNLVSWCDVGQYYESGTCTNCPSGTYASAAAAAAAACVSCNAGT